MGRLSGQQVALRGFRSEDLSGMRAWITDEQVTAYLSHTFAKPQTWEQTENYLQGMLNGDVGGVNMVICEKDTQKYLGQCNLMMIDNIVRKAELAIVLQRDHHGKGFGYEAIGLLLDFAFDQMNLNRVFLKVHEDNHRAIKLYERCGFVHEGKLRQDMYRDGRYLDILVMSILRHEHEARRAEDLGRS